MRRENGFLLRAIAGATLAAVLSAAPASFAQGSGKAAAEALFLEGRKLMTESKFTEACGKFAASHKLDPAPGTLINLANCYEKNGQTATAWVTYREAASDARQANIPEFVATAGKRGDALEPKLSKMTITVAAPVEGLHITRDGVTVGSAEWGTPIPVDPGKHHIEVSAPRKNAWSTDVEVGANAARLAVEVPALEDAPEEPKPAVPPPAVAPSPGPDPVPAAPEKHDGGSQRTIAYVVGGIGVVGLALGTVFVITAKSKFDDSLAFCRDQNFCTQPGVDLRDDARSQGNIATVAFGIGAAALIGGGVLFLTAPSSKPSAKSAQVQLVPTLGGALVRGSF